jgi:hypothetical protein
MAIDSQLYTPVSVVLAGTLIGAGLFLGLRERGAAPRLEGVERQAVPALHGAPVATAAAPLDRSAAQRAAEQALESQRAAIIASCIPPASRSGSASRLHINIAFDADGRQITRGIIPERSDPRRELAACATDALPSLTIPAQNAPAALDLLWTLP